MGKSTPKRYIAIGLAMIILSACETNPRKIDVATPQSAPTAKTTSLDGAIRDLGLMTQVYRVGVKFMPRPIGDNTGTAQVTKFEIPNDVTEMVKSILNAIGGNVQYIPYDPAFVQNSQLTGYSDFQHKILPDVIITGGITEFDRGLEIRSSGTDVDISATTRGNPLGFKYADAEANAISSITLDFNLLGFQTLAGLPRMQAVNTMKVGKAMAKQEIGFTILGPTFGMNGKVKKIQGRHAAVRVLVQLSMIQLTGRYLTLPYWRLLPEGSEDSVVTANIESAWFGLDEAGQTMEIQRLLYLHGYDVDTTGELGLTTLNAIAHYTDTTKSKTNEISYDLFKSLYVNLPLEHSTIAREDQWKAIQAQHNKPAPLGQRPVEHKTVEPTETSAPKGNTDVEYTTTKEPKTKTSPAGVRHLKASDW